MHLLYKAEERCSSVQPGRGKASLARTLPVRLVTAPDKSNGEVADELVEQCFRSGRYCESAEIAPGNHVTLMDCVSSSNLKGNDPLYFQLTISGVE